MSEKQRYMKQWQESVEKTADALKRGAIDEAEKCHDESGLIYEKYKRASDYEEDTVGSQFSTLNCMVENAIPKMYAKDKKALKECINLIKDDSNLLAQFKFCDALKRYNCDGNATDYVNESLALVSDKIDRKTLKESNRKLANFIVEHNIRFDENLTDEQVRFNESCDYLLSHKKSLANLTEMTNNVKVVSDYIEKNKKERDENKVDVFKMAEQVERKLNSLNEAERSLVGDIVAAKNPFFEERKKKIFKEIKEGCLEKINKAIDESNGEDKERLLGIKETVLGKDFNEDTLVEDVAKLLEIGAVLSDNA